MVELLPIKVVSTLNQAQITQAKQNASAIAAVGLTTPASTTDRFTFFAAFDGTRNNRDDLTRFNDIETIVNSRDLLANDSLGWFTGTNLTLTSVSNFKNGSGFLDANGFVHLNPTAYFSGTAPEFDNASFYYQNRSCWYMYLLGCRTRTYLKTAQKCSKGTSSSVGKINGANKQAFLVTKSGQSRLFLSARSFENHSYSKLIRGTA